MQDVRIVDDMLSYFHLCMIMSGNWIKFNEDNTELLLAGSTYCLASLGSNPQSLRLGGQYCYNKWVCFLTITLQKPVTLLAKYSEYIPSCSPTAEAVNPSGSKFAESILISRPLVSQQSAVDRRIWTALRVVLSSGVVTRLDCQCRLWLLFQLLNITSNLCQNHIPNITS